MIKDTLQVSFKVNINCVLEKHVGAGGGGDLILVNQNESCKELEG